MENPRDWKRTHYSKEVIPEIADQEVIVMGWVRALRDKGRIKFIKLADCEGFVQIVAKEGEVAVNVLEELETLKSEDVVAVRGIVSENRDAPGGREVVPVEIWLVNKAEKPLAIEIEPKKEDTLLPARLNERPLDLRNPENQAIFKIQAKFVKGTCDFLVNKGFLQVFTPCLIGGVSEGGADVFAVPYFDNEAFLRQDPQLHRELLIIAGFDKIFDLGPNWRAEKSHTTFHLCEHRGLAPEMGFIRDETETMRLEEQVIVAGLKCVAEDCEGDLKMLDGRVAIPETPFPELRFPEIYGILRELGLRIKMGDVLNREAENLLARYVREKHGSDFFFVNRFPFAFKPFYVMRVDENPEYARSVDLIYKGLEVSSGGQREHRSIELVKNIKEKELDLDNLNWFTKFFKYGVPPMGGFCLGIERFTMKLLNLKNIRETVLFPRDPERLLP